MGKHNYWDDDVYALMGARLKAKGDKIAAYFRVAGRSREADERLQSQKRLVLEFCAKRGISIDEAYEDRGPGARWREDIRPEFHRLIQDVMKGELAAVVMETRCRFTSFGWEMWEAFFKYYKCEVVIINKVIDDPYYQKEQSEDIARLLESAKVDRLPALKS